MDRAVFITFPDDRTKTVQIGPFDDGQLADDWYDALVDQQRGDDALDGAELSVDRYRPDQPSLDPSALPIGAVNVARHMDEWDRPDRHGHGVVDLYSLLLCKYGPQVASEVWADALELYDAMNAEVEEEPLLSEVERERIVARVNAEIDATDGERADGDTVGHVAYDTVMQELRARCNGNDPNSPGGRTMNALLEVIGTLYMLEGMAGDKGTVPFAANVKRAAELLENTRALLAEMLIFGSVSIEYSLAKAGLAIVSEDDVKDAPEVTKLIQRKIREALGEEGR